MDPSYSVPDEFKGDENLAELFSSDEDVSATSLVAALHHVERDAGSRHLLLPHHAARDMHIASADAVGSGVHRQADSGAAAAAVADVAVSVVAGGAVVAGGGGLAQVASVVNPIGVPPPAAAAAVAVIAVGGAVAAGGAGGGAGGAGEVLSRTPRPATGSLVVMDVEEDKPRSGFVYEGMMGKVAGGEDGGGVPAEGKEEGGGVLAQAAVVANRAVVPPPAAAAAAADVAVGGAVAAGGAGGGAGGGREKNNSGGTLVSVFIEELVRASPKTAVHDEFRMMGKSTCMCKM
jgi:hypothetical protein